MFRISDRAEGARQAPATPSRARLTISISGDCAYAVRTEVTRREDRGHAEGTGTEHQQQPAPHAVARVPMVTRKPAMANP